MEMEMQLLTFKELHQKMTTSKKQIYFSNQLIKNFQ